jgi:hypothetical protein
MLPELHTVLRVAVGSSPDPGDGLRAFPVPSRVEHIEPPAQGRARRGARLLVATPRTPRDDDPRPGTACTLTWTSGLGVFEVPVAFDSALAAPPEAPLRTWRVEVTGNTVRLQRREFFRCECSLPVTAEGIDRAGSRAGATGFTLDLGEGGTRCVLKGPTLKSGGPVRVSIELTAGNLLVLDGSVLRAAPRGASTLSGTCEPRPVETVVEFQDAERYGDVVRKAIFAEQLRQRRLGIV